MIANEAEASVSFARQCIDALVEMKLRSERLDLLHQTVGQLLAGDDRQRWHVVDRLLGIQLGALSAGPAENVDDMTFEIEQPEFEHCEQSARTRADDHDVCFNQLGIIVGSCHRFLKSQF